MALGGGSPGRRTAVLLFLQSHNGFPREETASLGNREPASPVWTPSGQRGWTRKLTHVTTQAAGVSPSLLANMKTPPTCFWTQEC